MTYQFRFREEPFEFYLGSDKAMELLDTDWADEVMTSSVLPTASAAVGDKPQGPFGSLTITAPEQLRFTYMLTPEDALWTARFIVGEAGGRDDPDNRAVIWAMFNRYAFFTHKYYKTFHSFFRAYSTPLQPVLRSWGAAKRHMHKPEFVRTGGFYAQPHDDTPRGQLQRFLRLQATPWSKLPQPARSLAEQAMKGMVANPIGNASEFGSTNVYFHDRFRRWPSDEEWRRYTEAYARSKGWRWIGPVSGLNQKKNAFFVQKRVANLSKNIVRVVPPGPAGEVSQHSFEMGPFEADSEFNGFGALPFEEDLEYEDMAGALERYGDGFSGLEGEPEAEFSFSDFPASVLNALRSGLEGAAIRLAVALGFQDGNKLTNLIFFTRHPELCCEPLKKGQPGYKQLSQEWLDIRDRMVYPVLSSKPVPAGPRPPEQPTITPTATLKWGVPGGRITDPFYRNREEKRELSGKTTGGRAEHLGIDVSTAGGKGEAADDPRRGLPVYATIKPSIDIDVLNNVRVRGSQQGPNRTGLGIPGKGPATLKNALVIEPTWHKKVKPENVINTWGGVIGLACRYTYLRFNGSTGIFTLYVEYLHLITKDRLPIDRRGEALVTLDQWLAMGKKIGFGPSMQNEKILQASELVGGAPLLIGYWGATAFPHVHIHANYKEGAQGYKFFPRFDPTVIIT